MPTTEDAVINTKEKVYDSEIAPLMSKIIDICKANDIPMLASFEYGDHDFATTLIPGSAPSEDMRRLSITIQRFVSGEEFTTPAMLLKISEC